MLFAKGIYYRPQSASSDPTELCFVLRHLDIFICTRFEFNISSTAHSLYIAFNSPSSLSSPCETFADCVNKALQTRFMSTLGG